MNKIAILDAGSQFGKLIDRRLHEIGIKTELLKLNTHPDELQEYSAAIISGSPGSVNSENAATLHNDFFIKFNKPVLGICYGLQLLNKIFGGQVASLNNREDGQFDILVESQCELFYGLNSENSNDNDKAKQENKSLGINFVDPCYTLALLTHGDKIIKLAPEFNTIALAGDVITGIKHKNKDIYGVQFHPEVNLTIRGKDIFKNFVHRICGLNSDYTIQNREEMILKEISSTVGDRMIIILVSGGVDSSVLAALCQKALGPEKANKQILALHIDNGFMRKNESEKVYQKLKTLGINLQVVHAQHKFLTGKTEILMKNLSNTRDILCETKPLYDTVEPEHKRKIIGDTFMRVTKYEIMARGIEFEECFIAQGTLRPDLIESASSLASAKADTIKTHHNDSPLVRELRKTGRVLEPLKDFHKDEVRQLGRDLGLSSDFVDRHPFPGPGLAIRILAHKMNDNNDPLKETLAAANDVNTASLIKTFVRYADANENPNEIFIKLNEKINPRDRQILLEVTSRLPKLSAVILPFRTVGVQGDARTYSLCAAISCDRADSEKYMNTVQYWKDLYTLAKILPTVAKYINRVVYIFSDERIDETPHFTTHTPLTEQIVEQLQEADDIALTLLRKHNCYQKISQMPVVLVPVDFQANDPRNFGYGWIEKKNTHPVLRSICLRPFMSDDFMTGLPALPVETIPMECIEEMVNSIENDVFGISKVMIDLTPKPPGTTEWE